MIKFIRQDDLNEEAWNKTVRKHGNGRPYAFSWYLDAVCDYWDALVYGDYEYVLPLPFYQRVGKNFGIMPPWAHQLGIIGPMVTEAIQSDFLLAIPKTISWVDWSLNADNTTQFATKTTQSYSFQCGPGMDPTAILNEHPHFQKIQFDYSVFRNDPPEALINLLVEQQKTDHPFDTAALERLKHLMHVGQHKRKGQVWSLYDRSNTLVAGAYIFYEAERITLHTLAGRPEDADRWPETILVQAILAETEPFPVLLEANEVVLPKVLADRLKPSTVQIPSFELNRLPWYLKWYRP